MEFGGEACRHLLVVRLRSPAATERWVREVVSGLGKDSVDGMGGKREQEKEEEKKRGETVKEG